VMFVDGEELLGDWKVFISLWRGKQLRHMYNCQSRCGCKNVAWTGYCPRGCRRNGFRHFDRGFRIQIISCSCYWFALFACSHLIVACRRRVAGVVMSTFCYLQVSV
jgi:hypothetical protein